jgi:peptide/nickel transport system permease protein
MPGARRRFLGNRAAVVGAAIALVVLLVALLAPLLAGDPTRPDLDAGLSAEGAPRPPHGDAPLGTDSLGRDVWARVAGGAALSLQVAALATAIALVIGVAIGLCAGYAGGAVDAALMRLVDMVLAFPFLLLAILLAALLREAELGGATTPVFITLGVVGWTTIARVVRGKVLALRELDYVHAARALGAGPARILARHLLPQVAGIALVLAALGFAQNILAEATLSYLGLGAPPPAPTWGRMLYEGQPYYRTAPWLIAAPGAAILLTVVAFQLVGEGLRDALDAEERR